MSLSSAEPVAAAPAPAPIPALPNFGLGHALGLMLAAALLESCAAWLGSELYLFGLLTAFTGWSPDPAAVDATIQILAKVGTCALLVALLLRRGREPWQHLGAVGFTSPAAPVAFLPIVAAVTIFVSEIDNFVRAFHSADGLDALDSLRDLDNIVGGSWQGIVLAVLIAPVVEEVLFRGLILRGLLGRWRPAAAILLSAALFSLMHLNLAQIPVTFVLGAVLGWVYVRTRSLGLCIAGHAINNAAAFLIGPLPFEVDNFNRIPEVAGTFFHPWWFDVLGLGLFACGLWWIYRLTPAGQPWLRITPPVPPRREPPLLPPPLLAPAPAANGPCLTGPVANAQIPMSAALAHLVTSLAQRARAASLVLATAPRAKKDDALARLADLIDGSHAALLAANALDLASPEAAALTAAARDRLTLNEKRLQHLAASVREVIALPDPVGQLLEETVRPNGLKIRKVRVPIGVIGIIYEARPNVTVDCAILCLKSGNASILRGGKECFHTNTALAGLIALALGGAGLPADAVQLVPTTDRAALETLLKLDTLIHCIIPRGGESLIRYVAQNSTIPVIKHYKGVCFVYVDAAADLAMAEAIVLNAKVQRPSACNAAEQLLVHASVAATFLPTVARALAAKGVQLRCDPAALAILTAANSDPSTFNSQLSTAVAPATAPDYTAEFLDYVIAVRVVDSLDAAVATINRDSSNHSDAIVTADEAAARRFLAEVDSATVYWNASTRFTDGYEFGYGAEIGISTDRLHARGPMGLPELCSYKFVIEGNGQVRP